MSAMFIMAILALGQDPQGGRLYGVGNLLGDPNDFALNLCMVLPLNISLLMSGRRWFSKVLWGGATLATILAIVSTYSRGGFLAMIAVLIAMWWRFRVRRNVALVAIVLTMACLGLAISAAGTTTYLDRLKSIIYPEMDATGSADARKQLLVKSIEVTIQSPLVGVGPGQFSELSGAWHESHNSYTQLSAEAGIPALLIFIALIVRSFKNLRLPRTMETGTEEW